MVFCVCVNEFSKMRTSTLHFQDSTQNSSHPKACKIVMTTLLLKYDKEPLLS
jgi:hypothetical protein